jgi:hypothetical protein
VWRVEPVVAHQAGYSAASGGPDSTRLRLTPLSHISVDLDAVSAVRGIK